MRLSFQNGLSLLLAVARRFLPWHDDLSPLSHPRWLLSTEFKEGDGDNSTESFRWIFLVVSRVRFKHSFWVCTSPFSIWKRYDNSIDYFLEKDMVFLDLLGA